MRMEYPGTTDQDEQKIRNRLQQRMARFREKFSMVSWRDTAGENNAIRDRVLSRLTPAQIAARGGLGSTRGSTPGSRDSQGGIIPLPGRRTRAAANTGDAATQVDQSQAQTVHAGPSNAPTINAGLAPVDSQVNRPSGSHGGSRTSQQNVQNSLVNPNRQQKTRASLTSGTISNYQRNSGQSTTMGSAPQNRPSTSSYTADIAPLPYSAISTARSLHQESLPITGGPEASGAENARIQHNQTSTVYAGNRSTEYVENISQVGPFDDWQVPDEPSTDGNFGDIEGYGHDDFDDVNDEDSLEGAENVEDNMEPNVEMPLAEEDPRMEPISDAVRQELQRYLTDDRVRIQMCLDGRISLDELLWGMQRNHAVLEQGVKRARGEVGDDNEVEGFQNQRAKRTRRGEDAAGSSSQPLPRSPNPTHSPVDNSQSGPSENSRRQDPLTSTSRRPTARPFGSAVERLHNDRRRRPAPKSTTAQKDMYDSLHYPQPDPVTENEWTVYGYHTDSQQPTNPPQQGHGFDEEGFDSNPGQPQRELEPYQPQQDNGVETRRPHENTGERQPPPSSHPQRQPDSEPFRSDLDPAVQNVMGDVPSNGPEGPTESNNFHHPGSSVVPAQPTRNEDEHIPPHLAYQHYTASTAQDDPFFPDELFNGMLNGHPDNTHVGSIYTLSQQQEIDNYYRHLMAPRPSSASQQTSAPQNSIIPPPPLVPPRPADGSDLTVGDISQWDPAWSAFVHDDDDAEALLRAQYPDEYAERSPPAEPR